MVRSGRLMRGEEVEVREPARRQRLGALVAGRQK